MSITVNNIPKDYTWAKLTSMTAQEKLLFQPLLEMHK